ncbi:hypothetical protein [Tardiphaga sp. P9-11]|uniref:hypothetical protein n=1 Tax=Tardiphaga sp. P9-11 TaxID=2024614 RepID=UPI0011F39B2A|nr:hypothetical protein [Tardiphaga sp. P9-11]KAA0076340.1 hypothetical protein CIW50_08885 [Tardiphaga sp. P9-11]
MSKPANPLIPAIFRVPAIWLRRIHFRAQLRADIASADEFLDDIGINLFDAQVEAMRFFWQPVLLMRSQPIAPDATPADEIDITLQPSMLRANVAKAAAHLQVQANLEVN